MKITVEICKIIIMSSPDNPCKKTQMNQISILIQKEAIFRCYTDIASDLISYYPKLFIVYMNQKIGHFLIEKVSKGKNIRKQKRCLLEDTFNHI